MKQMRGKVHPGRGLLFLLTLLACPPGWLAEEPQPPEVLELVSVDQQALPGPATVEVVVKPAFDSTIELEILEPAGVRFESGAEVRQFEIRRGGAEQRARIRVDVPGNGATSVVVRLTAFADDGEAWLSMDRKITLPGAAPAAPPGTVVRPRPQRQTDAVGDRDAPPSRLAE
jgi:hypothetical protein